MRACTHARTRVYACTARGSISARASSPMEVRCIRGGYCPAGCVPKVLREELLEWGSKLDAGGEPTQTR